MRAAKSRGSRTRSPSSASKLIKKTIVKSPAPPGFFFCIVLRLIRQRETISGVQIFIWCDFAARKMIPAWKFLRVHREADACDSANAFSNVTVDNVSCFTGYPVSLSTKKRDCLVAYSHSAAEHFKNAFNARRNVNE
jgi:hypothetical protein